MCKNITNKFLSILLCGLIVVATIFAFPLSNKANADEGVYVLSKEYDFTKEEDRSLVINHDSYCSCEISFDNEKLLIAYPSAADSKGSVNHCLIRLPYSTYFEKDIKVEFSLTVHSDENFNSVYVVGYFFEYYVDSLDPSIGANRNLSSGNYFLSRDGSLECEPSGEAVICSCELPVGSYGGLTDVQDLCFVFGEGVQGFPEGCTYEVSNFKVYEKNVAVSVDKSELSSISLSDSTLKALKIVASCLLGVCAVIFVVSIIPQRKRK